jgi:hypothetical protein
VCVCVANSPFFPSHYLRNTLISGRRFSSYLLLGFLATPIVQMRVHFPAAVILSSALQPSSSLDLWTLVSQYLLVSQQHQFCKCVCISNRTSFVKRSAKYVFPFWTLSQYVLVQTIPIAQMHVHSPTTLALSRALQNIFFRFLEATSSRNTCNTNCANVCAFFNRTRLSRALLQLGRG